LAFVLRQAIRLLIPETKIDWFPFHTITQTMHNSKIARYRKLSRHNSISFSMSF